jgi:hypothetical protein
LADSPNTVYFTYGTVVGVISKADRVLGTDGNGYICKKEHIAASLNKPISGAEWSKYWELNGTLGSPLTGATTDCLTWTESASYSRERRIPSLQ